MSKVTEKNTKKETELKEEYAGLKANLEKQS